MSANPPSLVQILQQNFQKLDTIPIQIPSFDLVDFDNNFVTVREYSSSVTLVLEKRTGAYWTAKTKKMKNEQLLI
jgi:hypothetical protein